MLRAVALELQASQEREMTAVQALCFMHDAEANDRHASSTVCHTFGGP